MSLNKSKAPLPYDMAVTLIFRSFGISFEGEATSHLSYMDTYNNHSLCLIDFFKVDGHWVKYRGTGDDEEEEEDRAEEEGSSSPPHEHAPTFILFLSLRQVLQQ